MTEGLSGVSRSLYQAAQEVTTGVLVQGEIASDMNEQLVGVAASIVVDLDSIKTRLSGLFTAIRPLVQRGEGIIPNAETAAALTKEALSDKRDQENHPLRQAVGEYATRAVADLEPTIKLEEPINSALNLAAKLYSAMSAIQGRAVEAQDRVSQLHDHGQATANNLQEKAALLARL